MKSIGYVAELTKKELGFAIRKATLPRIKKALSRKGYMVWNYSAAQDKLAVLGLLNESKKAKSVSFVDENNILIFVDDSITEEMQLFAIVHEIGHIKLEHKVRQLPKEEQEQEANEFAAHFLLSSSVNIWKIISLMLAVVLLLTSMGFLLNGRSSDKPTSSETVVQTDVNATYYWTTSGTVYHYYADCQSLKHSINILNGSLSKAQKSKDRLCKFCERQYKENEK